MQSFSRAIDDSRIPRRSLTHTLRCVITLVVGSIGAANAWSQNNPLQTAPVKIFFDTDMETDCDDAGALAILHALADNGECEILATVCSVRDPHAVATVESINTYYGRPQLPLGVVKGAGVLIKSKFAEVVSKEFRPQVRDAKSLPDAVDVYREVLEKQPDHSVVIVTVGYLTNLKGLLELPAKDDRPSGRDLIAKKVSKWICLGGNFVGDPPRDDLKLGNVNFQRDVTSAHFVVTQWQGPVVFVGREIGSVPSGLSLGTSLTRTPKENPVRRAYELYFGGTAKNRHVADLTAVLYAVRGERDYWSLRSDGYMDLRTDMTFDWRKDAAKQQSFLLKKMRDGKPNDRYIEEVLDELLIQPPRGAAK